MWSRKNILKAQIIVKFGSGETHFARWYIPFWLLLGRYIGMYVFILYIYFAIIKNV